MITLQQPKFRFPLTILCLLAILSGMGYWIFWPKGSEAAWFDDNWGYRTTLSFTHNAAATFQKVKFDVDTATLITAGKLQSDCGDSRFTDINGALLRYYIDTAGGDCNTSSTDYYVLIPVIINGSNAIYHYYGNPSAENGTESAQFSEATLTPSGGAATVGSEEKTPGPIIYWKFDDGTGTTAQDYTANNLDGTLNNTPAWQTEDVCVAGKCLYFDGTNNENVSRADNVLLDFAAADNFTVSAWVRRPQASSANNFIITKAQSGYTGYKLYQDASGDYCFDVSDGTNTDTACTSAVEFDDSRWHLVQGVKTGTTSITLYVDGIQKAQDASIAATGTLANTGTFYIGVDLDGISNEWLGFIDEVKLYPYARSATQIQTDFASRGSVKGTSGSFGSSVPSGSSLSNGLVGYWKMDEASGNLTDSSGNGKTGTVTGTTVVAGKFGNGRSFNGSTDYADLGNNTFGTLINGASGTTASYWINLAGLPTSGNTFQVYGVIMGSNGAGVSSSINSSGNVANGGRSQSSDGLQGVTSLTVLSTSTWYHVVDVFDYKKNTVSVYINGALDKTTSASFGLSTYSNSWTSGSDQIGNFPGQTRYLNGKLDNMRIYNRVLSPAEISALYNFAPGPVGYWKFDEKNGTAAEDSSGNGNQATLTNTPTWTNGKYGAGISFAGSNQHVTRADDADFDFIDDADVTVEAWIKHAATSTQEIILSKYQEAGYKIIMESDGDLTCALDYDNTWTPTDSATSTAATYDDNNWHHISCVKIGASSLNLYIDGVLIATDSSLTATNTLTNSDPLYIGIDADGTSNDWIGQIDDVKIYNYARTSKQVVEDLNAGHPAVGSPVGSAVGYWKFDEGVDNTCSGGTNDACNSGSQGSTLDGTNTATRSMSGKFGGALNFDGTDDVVTVANVNAIDFDTSLSNFSFTTWVNADSDGEADTGQIFQKGTSTYLRTDSQSGSNLDIEANLDLATSDANVNISSGITTSSWNHIAVTWNGTTLTVYVNGVSKGTGTGSGAISSDANNLLIGGTTTNNFDGTIDEFKVYNYSLTADEVKTDMNRGSSQVLGSISDKTGTGYEGGSQAANQEYCVPGDSNSCAAPVGEWRFDEKQGTLAFDKSGNANNGTWSGTLGSQWTQGKFGSGGKFNGSDNYVDIGDPSSEVLDFGTGDFTLSAWIKTSTTGVYQDILDKRITTNGYLMGVTNDNKFGIFAVGGGNNVSVVGNTTVTNGKWHYVVATFDRDGNASVYLDGVLDATPVSMTTVGTVSSTGKAVIGYHDPALISIWSYFNGWIDQVRAYNYLRTPAQIAWEYNRGAPVGHWKFDECQGTTANDSSGNSNTGTITVGASGTQTAVGTCTGSANTAWKDGATGKYNSSLDFDGTDDYVNIGNISALSFDRLNPFSFSFWIKTTNTSTEIVLDKFASNVGHSLSINNIVTGGWFFVMRNTVSTNELQVRSSDSGVTDGNWHHGVLTYSGSSSASGVSIYIDGKSIALTTQSDTLTSSIANSANLAIGARDSGVVAPWAGQLDDVKIFNYALTATQVKTLYGSGAVRFGPVTGSP